MTWLVVLDAGPLGLVTNPRAEPDALRCQRWLKQLLLDGARVGVTEIADYEVRRELIRARKAAGLARLEALVGMAGVTYVPVSTASMRLAAEFWARARQGGRPTADPHALDCDVILAAQTELLRRQGEDAVVATTNLRHLSLFVPAAEWWTIRPEPPENVS